MLRLAGRRALTVRSHVSAFPAVSALHSPLLNSEVFKGQQQSALHTAPLFNSRNPRPDFAPAFVGTKAFSTTTEEPKEKEEQSFLDRTLGPDTVWAEPTFTNRWAMVIPAFCTHMCIGSPWAWSVMTYPLTMEYGFVTSAADDWSMADATWPLSVVFALQGISAAAAGKWQMKVGARQAMAFAGCCFGFGLMTGGIGIALHNKWLLYAGYGLLGGTGVGVAYTPPVQALIEWFPDKKGLASGLCVGGFGSGGLLFAPAVQGLMQNFSVLPTYLGAAVETVTKEGRLYADVGGQLQEVVYANSADIAKLSYDLGEGYYVVGTGNTGAASAMFCCGIGYLAIMLTSAYVIRRPYLAQPGKGGFVPEGWTPPAIEGGGPARNVSLDTAMTTPQMALLGTTFFCMATGGMGIFAVAKPLMADVFSGSLPLIATASFGGSYVLMLSAANLGGRLAWPATSDIIGRRNTFLAITLASVPLYLAIPFLVDSVVTTGSAVPLYAFVGTTVFAITCMGGCYALLPAYEADLFGAKYVGPIHGRMLMASTCAALAGPAIILGLRQQSETAAMANLLSIADPAQFESQFGAPISTSADLISNKTVTIAKLMDVVPAGTVDPTPYLYDTTMYTMAGFMSVAALSHYMVGPIDPKYYEDVEPLKEPELVIEVEPVDVKPMKP